MRKLLFTLSLIFVFGINSYAQEEKQNENELNYSAKETVELDSKKETITLIGEASLKTSVFEFKNADKIVIDKVSKEVLIKGKFKVVLNGGTIQKSSELKKNQLRYRLGDKIAYVE